MTPVDPTEITDALADPAEDELRALGTATAALGDRHAVATVVVLKPSAVGKTEASCLAAVADRRFMTSPEAVVDRMARDILAARRDGQHGHLIDLTEFGWSQAQAMRWGTAAHEAARSAAVVTQDAVERLAARESAHVASLAPFDVDRIAAAGEAAVAAALGEAPDDFGGAAA